MSNLLAQIPHIADTLLDALPYGTRLARTGTVYGGFLRFIAESITRNHVPNIEDFRKYNTDVDISTTDEPALRSIFTEIVNAGGIIEYYGMHYDRSTEAVRVTLPRVEINLPDDKLVQGNYAVFINSVQYDISLLPYRETNDFTANILRYKPGEPIPVNDSTIHCIDDIRDRKLRWIYQSDNPKVLYRARKMLARGYTIADPVQSYIMALENGKYKASVSSRKRDTTMSDYQYAYNIQGPTTVSSRTIRTRLEVPMSIHSINCLPTDMLHLFTPVPITHAYLKNPDKTTRTYLKFAVTVDKPRAYIPCREGVYEGLVDRRGDHVASNVQMGGTILKKGELTVFRPYTYLTTFIM
jgi:hypothetical protein